METRSWKGDPARLGSTGVTDSQLNSLNELLWNGPQWLRKVKDSWLKDLTLADLDEVKREKKNANVMIAVKENPSGVS